MKRSLGAYAAILGVLASLLVSVGLVAAPAAQARCIPANDVWTIYKFKDRVTLYHPTNIASDWVYWPHGGSITYSKTATAETNASVTATVEAEAGVIFAKASTSFGVNVGKSWSKSDSWSYTATVPKGTGYKYRLHMYHYSFTFKVMKKRWSSATCTYSSNVWSSWQTVRHAPVKANSNIWRLDKRAV